VSVRASEPLAQSAEFRRFLLGSFIGHVLLLIAFLVVPGLRLALQPPAPVYVDLIAAAPAPAPKPKPAPRQKLDQPVVLQPKKRIPPKPKPVPKEVPVPKEPPKETLSAAEILGRLREQVGDEPERTATEAAPRGRFDPQMAAYQRRVRVLLQSNWAGVGRFQGEQLVARFEVQIDSAGGVRSLRRVQSSGSRYFDDSAERAIRRSEPLPPPPRGAITLDLGFNPKGVF
jgi:TonB family protein